MNIHQMSINYVAAEDRLLLRINTHDHQEILMWWTRRLLQLIWPHLRELAARLNDGKVNTVATSNPATKQMMAEFSHREAIAKADFKTPYQAKNHHPLGKDPLLMTELTLKLNGQAVRFECKTMSNTEFVINFNEQLYHALMHLLESSSSGADWALDLGVATSLGHRDGDEKPVLLN